MPLPEEEPALKFDGVTDKVGVPPGGVGAWMTVTLIGLPAAPEYNSPALNTCPFAWQGPFNGCPHLLFLSFLSEQVLGQAE